MRLQSIRPSLVVLLGLSLAPGLFAQTPNPNELPSVGDLREEQRIINNAYLARGENFIAKSKEQIADNLLRPAKENGFYAVELLSRARRLLDKHPSRIEQARGIFGRATEGSREELRKNLREQIDPRYFGLQGKLEGVATALASKGDNSLQQALDAAKVGDSARVEQLMRSQGIAPKEGSAGDIAAPPSSAAASIPGIPGATVTQAGPGQVAVTVPGVGTVNIPGTLSADGRYIDSPYGRVDLSTGVKLPDGSTVFQTDKGVLVLGKDGQWHLMAGAKLNPDGSVTTPDGRTVPAAQVGAAAMGSLGPNPGSFSGRVPPGTVVLDQNGNRITIDADFQNGEQTGVKKDYIGGAGATLVSETKVTRKLVQATGSEWRVNVVPGESRSWNFAIRMGEQKSASGTVNLTLTVDGGGSTGFTIRSWEIADDKGSRASVTPSTSNPAQAVATFTKGGEYTFSVAGETDWGSPFRVKGQGGVYP